MVNGVQTVYMIVVNVINLCVIGLMVCVNKDVLQDLNGKDVLKVTTLTYKLIISIMYLLIIVRTKLSYYVLQHINKTQLSTY
jgi:hypothetical protein